MSISFTMSQTSKDHGGFIWTSNFRIKVLYLYSSCIESPFRTLSKTHSFLGTDFVLFW